MPHGVRLSGLRYRGSLAEARARPIPQPQTGDFYVAGRALVFTAQYRRRRGYCCGSGSAIVHSTRSNGQWRTRREAHGLEVER